MRRRRLALTVFVGAIIALLAAGYGYWYYHSFFESTGDARVFTLSSTLQSKVNGKIQKILVGTAQAVKAGDLLVQLEPREFEVALEQRERELDRSEDRLAGAKEAAARLLGEANTSDAGRQAYKNARTYYLKQQTKTQALRDRVAEARENLAATQVRAPADGHVAQIRIDAGKTVTAGQPLVEFVGAGRPWVIANFNEVQLAKMKVGQRAEITVPELHKTFAGLVETMPPLNVPAPAKAPYLALIERYLKPGERFPVRVAFDPNAIRGDETRIVGGAPAEIKVYVK